MTSNVTPVLTTLGKHTICVVVNDEFLRHQASIGNDLITGEPRFQR